MDLPASTEEARRVFCVYPVSGTYTSFQRSLFYLTTALALLGHAHEWLAAACLAFTVSYSSTAAVHGLALACFQGDSLLHHDSDFLAVDVIVHWALYASIVCALFCPQLLGRNLYVLVGAWCVLLAAAHLAVVFSSPRLVRDIAASDLSQRRHQAAKYAALSFYILTTLGYVTWIPVVAPFATGGATRFLARIPESETFRAVGQWSPWLTLSLAIATTLVSRLLGTDQIKSMDSWVQQHRFNLLYAQVRGWLAAEWRETKECWSNPEKQVIASLRTVEQDDDTEYMFTSRMIQALEEFSTGQAGFLLPPPWPSQPDEQLRGQDYLPVHDINRAELISTRSTARKGKGKERQA